MKKKLYILLVLCLASAFLAGCIATNATVLMDEEFSEDSTAEGLTGMESDKLPEDDRCSDETTNVYDWDAQKGWSVFAGYYDAPEMYCSTGVFSLLGFPYEEQIEWAHQRALQQGVDVLFHVCFEIDADIASAGLSAERVSVRWDGKSREMLHADLSVADMMHLASTMEGIHFFLCECGAQNAEPDIVKLWWETLAD